MDEKEDWLGLGDKVTVAAPEAAPRHARRGRPRRDARVEAVDRHRGVSSGAEARFGSGKQPEVEDSDGRGRGEVGGSYDPFLHCPGCERGHGFALEVQALQILKRAGEIFNENLESDRATAFEKRASYLAANGHILVGSRVMKERELD